MSHHQFFYLFENQEPVEFPLEQLLEIVDLHGCAASQVNSTSFDVALPGVGLEGGIYLNDGGVYDFSIFEPVYGRRFFALAADLITELGLVMFSDNELGTYIRDPAQQSQIPESISTNAAVIRNADELESAFNNGDVYRELSKSKLDGAESWRGCRRSC